MVGGIPTGLTTVQQQQRATHGELVSTCCACGSTTGKEEEEEDDDDDSAVRCMARPASTHSPMMFVGEVDSMPNASVTRMETAQLCTIPHRRGAGCHVCGDEETRSALTAACREPAPSVCPQRVRCAHATGWHQGPSLASRAQWWAARCPGRCCPLSAWGLGPTLSRWPRLGTMWSTAGQQAQQQGSFQKGWEWMACLPATAASGALPQGGQGSGWCVGNPLLGGGCSAHLVDTGELVALCACAVQRDGAGVWRLRGVGPVGLGHRRGLARPGRGGGSPGGGGRGGGHPSEKLPHTARDPPRLLEMWHNLTQQRLPPSVPLPLGCYKTTGCGLRPRAPHTQ